MPLLLVIAAFLVSLFAEFPVDDAAADWTYGYPPYETEDPAGSCYWDAEAFGRLGASFVVGLAGDPAKNDADAVIYVGR